MNDNNLTRKQYDEKYGGESFYWSTLPSKTSFEVLKHIWDRGHPIFPLSSDFLGHSDINGIGYLPLYRRVLPSRPLDEEFVVGDSLTSKMNPKPYRYQHPACRTGRGRQTSLIQALGFGERPLIVPPEVRCLNVHHRALSPKE
jgi:hypothetical protein